ncbi:glycosyltransferase [Algoriphagus chordae]|uniref:Glycosyltransferase involved in cell wall biosynthesis n=1 Tax=Algoriphagus chordae TaxID=237019 RepID=A0A2W7R113_9BACT|nr:glycosyltransferase [Algoriphagus chordae]PZX47769.1 glycosyltransferase involved in cell wall biosynthesis [Algoriphagus chordae]
MKIIQLIQKPQRRGAEIFAAQLSEQLRLTGNEILLVSIFEGDADLPFKGKWIKLNKQVSHRFFDFNGWSQFSTIVKDFKPDIIQANAADTLKFSVFSKRLFGWKAPIIYRNANQMGDFIRNGFHQKFNQYLLNQVSGIVSVSNASAANLHDTFRFPQDKSTTIPIGIDSMDIDLKLQQKPTLPMPEDFLLQIGGLVEEKDPLGMLDIFFEIHKDKPGLKLIFMGSGNLKSKLEDRIKELGLASKVQLIPSQQNIFPILSKAKALVMPSKIEGLPGVILEAMYCKVPVIAYDVGGIREVIKNENGWLVPAGKPVSFEKAIVSVLNSSKVDLKAKLFKAMELIEDQYTISKISNQFGFYYKSIR